jgi:citrate synthase
LGLEYGFANLINVPKGLEGVVVAQTKISKIEGEKGHLINRGYDATDLARKLSFEQVAYLLWFGKLSTHSELDNFSQGLKLRRPLPKIAATFLQSFSSSNSPLSVLRTVTSLLGMYSKDDEPANETGMSLVAKFPVILTEYNRLRAGSKIIEPNPDLSHAENYLFMLTGKVPAEAHVSALNSYLILQSDHGMNASTFAARVAISTLTDTYSAIVAAIGTLKGPLHGGAPSRVWEMLKGIGKKENSRPWLKERIDSGQKIMGFGHRIYRTEDPRSRVLKEIARRVSDPEIYELATTVEEDARELLHKSHPERILDTNVEFYSSLVLNAISIPTDMFTPTFASARVVGWIAHIMEQLSDNRIFRPESEYIGPEGLRLR